MYKQLMKFFKQTKKEYDKKLELVCLYNLAATYQKYDFCDAGNGICMNAYLFKKSL